MTRKKPRKKTVRKSKTKRTRKIAKKTGKKTSSATVSKLRKEYATSKKAYKAAGVKLGRATGRK